MSNNKVPAAVTAPGGIIRRELEARGWSQADLAAILGRPLQAVNEIIAAKKAITPETAIELAAAFGMSAEFFLNLETAYRLSLAKRETGDVERRARLYAKVPVRELIKRGWIAPTRDIDDLEWQVCEFLGISSIDEEPNGAFAARKADGYDQFTPGQVAWLFRCRQIAQRRKLPAPFHLRGFSDTVPALPREFADERTVERLPERLAQLGVHLVALEHLPGTKIDGAAFWLDNHPVIALSVRFDRIDSFWYTLMHESAHIVLHGRDFTSLDVDLFDPGACKEGTKPPREREADQQACKWLVPADKLERFIAETKPYYSHHKIERFAESVGVHPGVVVGQLQHRGEIGWGHSRKYLVKVRHYLPLES